jgi:hypothetical protein
VTTACPPAFVMKIINIVVVCKAQINST